MITGRDTTRQLDHLFRHEAGKMVAIITHFLGMNHLELAEDAVQDAFAKALPLWKLNGLPEKPEAWLLQTARNRAIDLIRRDKKTSPLGAVAGSLEVAAEQFFHSQEIGDSQLRMMFACCHPSLRRDDQVALTLQLVCAFSMAEIARALVSNETVIQKRLSRAKALLREKGIGLEIPAGRELQQRLDTVYAVLYLLFNEGYNSLKTDELIRHDLCTEAMRCCKLLTDHALVQQPAAHALLALMCLHAARFNSRLTDNNDMILLKQQDRSLWDRELIQVGLGYLDSSAKGNTLTSYHIEAAIAAEHCLAEKFADTNWKRLLGLYDTLLEIKQSPIIRLNRAIVLSEAGNTAEAIAAVLQIPDIDRLLLTHHIYSAVLGDLYKRLSNTVKARQFLEKAWQLTPSLAEKKMLMEKLDDLGRRSN